jgi:PAS domain S-box-containing protein
MATTDRDVHEGPPPSDDARADSRSPDPTNAHDGPLDVLLLEDVATDAELIQHELRQEGINFEAQHVTSRDGFRLALDAGPPDIILADYSLPAFDGLDALEMAKERHPDVPVVFVSGAIGEERAIETLKQGATDYVLKDKLSRLAPAVKRALREAAERQARREAEEALKHANEVLEQKVEARTAELRQANAVLTEEIEERKRVEAALRESQERLSALIDSAIDAIVSVDPSLEISLFNRAAEDTFGCAAEEAVSGTLDVFLTDDLQALVEQYIEQHPAADEKTHDGRYVGAAEGLQARRMDGTTFAVEATIAPVQLASDPQYLLILRDIQEMKHAEEKLTRLQSEKVYLQEEIENEYNFEEIVGVSSAIHDVFDAIDQVAATDTTVLISGETGTGKELVARALHDRSRRADSVLVKVNCAALSSDLIESELFGHEKGAFTGATAQREGRFELADGGTLFLDEVGELPLDTQAKLLRALQEQAFERVGGSETIEVDTRILAATNRDLGQAVQEGTFRSDLYYRLNIFPIELPPLKERREDIPLLAHHFCDTFAGRTGKEVERISPNAMAVLERYDWPGNVRELANIIERAVILTRDDVIRAEHLSIERPDADEPGDTFPTYEEARRRHVIRALERTDGVVGGDDGAAALLDVNRTTLLSRMDRLGIDPDEYR